MHDRFSARALYQTDSAEEGHQETMLPFASIRDGVLPEDGLEKEREDQPTNSLDRVMQQMRECKSKRITI